MTAVPLIVLLGTAEDDEDHQVVFAEVRRLGGEARRVHPNELVTEVTAAATTFLVDGESIRPDLVVGWVYRDYLIVGMNQLETFRLAGIPVVNSGMTLMRGQSKYLNSALLHRAGVRHLPVLWGRDEATLVSWAARRGYPLVTKPLRSSSGIGVRRLDDESSVRDYVGSLDDGPDHYYAQPFVRSGNRDTRVLCVNHLAVFAVTRTARDGSWISTAEGSSRSVCELTEGMRAIAERASEAMGALFAGVDVVHDDDTGELRVYEVNTCPTCLLAFQTLGVEPVALTELASFLMAATRDFEQARREWRPRSRA